MKKVAEENIEQLSEMLQRSSNEQYTQKSEILSGSSVGQDRKSVV